MEKIINHTFVIMAYKESIYLEECIKSVINQSIKSNVILSTSTPNLYIESLARKYNLPIFINYGKGDMADNWNFAFSLPNTKFVTLCHQDDIYNKDYLKEISTRFNEKFLIIHTAWNILKNNEISTNICVKVHRILNYIVNICPKNRYLRKFILSFGNSVKIPSVCYNKSVLPKSLWKEGFKCNLDWESILNIYNLPGQVIYIHKPLFSYRVSSQAASYEYTSNGIRYEEDLKMFCKFWPRYIAKFILFIYKRIYE